MSSNPSPSPSEAAYPTPSSDHTPPESIAATLERLSTAVVTALNARDFDFTSETAQELVRHLAPDFKAELDSLPNQNRPRTFEEQKIAWKKRIEQYPDVHFEIVGMDSQVDEKKGRGSVYMSMEVTGMGEGIVIHAMNELQWRRAGDTWFCHHVFGMRGSMANTGGIG